MHEIPYEHQLEETMKAKFEKEFYTNCGDLDRNLRRTQNKIREPRGS